MLAIIRRKIYNLSKKMGDRIGIDLPYFVENGFWMILNQMINIIVAFVVSVIFARYLTKEVFGQYQLVLSFIGIFAIISLPGLNGAIARSVAKGKDYSYNVSIQTSLKWSLLGIPFLLLVAYWYFNNAEFNVSMAILIAAVFFPIIHTYSKWSSFLIGKTQFNKIAIYTIIQNIISTVIYILVAINFSDQLFMIIGAYLICNAFFKYLWHRINLTNVTNRKVDPECIPYGIFMSKTTLFNLILNHFDKIIIGFLDIELLAVYAISLKLLDVFKAFIKSFLSISYPKFVKHKIKIKTHSIILLMFIGFLLSLFLFFISEPIITYFYTEKYTESAFLFNKLIFVLPMIFVNPLLANKAFAEVNKKMILNIRIWVPLISIISSVLVIIISKNTEYFLITKIYSVQIAQFAFLVIKKK